jgi:hypothetical protein
VYYNEKLVTNSKFQTQLPRKLQQFRTCRKNKKCSICHDLFDYIIFFHMVITDWTGPLMGEFIHINPKPLQKIYYEHFDIPAIGQRRG